MRLSLTIRGVGWLLGCALFACDDGGGNPPVDRGQDSAILDANLPDLAPIMDAMPDAKPDATPDARIIPDVGVDGGDAGCTPGAAGCVCAPEAVCDAESVCEDGRCVPCTPAHVDCPCDAENACESPLVCDADETVCRETRSCMDIACAPNQRCDAPADQDASCLPDCVPGFVWNAETQQCDPEPEANCEPGAPLSIADECTALNRVCIETPDGPLCGACLPGQTDEGGQLEACRPYLTCESLDCAAVGRQCAPPAPATDAFCGDCLAGLEAVGDQCLPPAEPNCQADARGSLLAECAAQGRICVEDGAATRCGACAGERVEVDGQCIIVRPTCAPDGLGSIAAECAAAFKNCVEVDDGAVCAVCLDGFREGPNDTCIPACDAAACGALGRVCGDDDCAGCQMGLEPLNPADPRSVCLRREACAPDTCPDGTFCIEQALGEPPLCNENPCLDGEALRRDVNAAGQVIVEQCVECQIACGEPGETGNIWPYTRQNDNECLCETLPGFFYSAAGGRVTRPCDADGDGWVRFEAARVLFSQDPEERANARCDLRQIDRFVLQNEYHQSIDVLSCLDGLHGPDDGPCDGVQPIPLFEELTADSPDDLPVMPDFAANGVGRVLRAEEINPLTKACLPGADINQNGVDDVNESHVARPALGVPDTLQVFTQMSAFMEVVDGFYQPAPLNDQPCETNLDCNPGTLCVPEAGFCRARFGAYVLRERSRCDADFPLGYRAGEGTYWRNCTRNRDARWDTNPNAEPPLSPVGFDFAQYSCDRRQGTCVVPPPPTDAFVGEEAPPHGLCDPDVQAQLPPADGVWRGMSHHSQFKCVSLADVNEAPDPVAMPQRVSIQSLFNGSAGALQLQQCRIECPADDPECAADCDDDGCASSTRDGGVLANPTQPTIRCTPIDRADPSVQPNAVGFAAVRYLDAPGEYQMGCIDEWEPGPLGGSPAVEAWKQLCPGYVDNPRAINALGNPTAFGKLMCGCGANFGGIGCETGCTQPMHGGPAENGGDEDCLQTDPVDPEAGAYCPRGTLEAPGRSGFWLCGGITTLAPTLEIPFQHAEDDDAVGWRVRAADIRNGARACADTGEVACDDQGENCEPVVDCDEGWSLR